MKKRLESAVLAILLCLSLLPTAALAETDTITPTVPEKDENGVYQISNANELYGFAEIVNKRQDNEKWNPHANAVLTADITVNKDVLNTDGTLNTEKKDTFVPWTPIGHYDSEGDHDTFAYKGTFDGQNHTISGLYCDTDQVGVGLFGYALSLSYVKNVTVADSYFRAGGFVGGVCGLNQYCIVVGCINKSTVIGTKDYGSVGGLCGQCNYGYIEKCSNFGTVIGTGAHSSVGGVCGYNGFRFIAGCYNAGTVTGNGRGVGGVCGSNSQGYIIGCHNVGVVTGNANYIGGLYGYTEHDSSKGCYYLDNDAVEDDGQARTAADFKNGTVCDLLNKSLEEYERFKEIMFYQGKDYPVLTPQIAFIGIEDGNTYCGEVSFTVRCAESVTENGVKLEVDNNDQYILLPGEHTITATDADGKSEIIKVTVNADHTPADAVRENEVAATCSAAGSYDEVVYCSVCNAEISRTQKTIDKLPHDFGNNLEYCANGCGTKNPNYVPPYNPPHKPSVKPNPTPSKPETPENPFVDVKEDDYYYDAVIWAVGKGIAKGVTDTTFQPNASCTRAEMVTFLYRAAGSPEPTNKVNPFTDVAEDSYYYKAVLWAVEKGIAKGTSETTFSPNDTCTRGQTVAFLYRYANSPAVSGSNSFADVSETAYYYDATLWAVSEKVTEGTSATTFSPNDLCTRGQIVTFLYRYMGK